MKAKAHRNTTLGNLTLFLPGFLIFAIAVVVPFFIGLRVALTNWDGISQTMDYVGFRNFRLIAGSSEFRAALNNSLYFAILITVANNVLSLAIALGLNNAFKGRGITRSAFFFPTCLSTVLAAFIWNFLFRDVFSELWGVKSMLGNMDTVIPGIVIIALWNSVGINIVIYLAGLTSIPRDLYEAAIVDGAGAWQKFRKITVPMLMPAFTVCVTMTLVSGLKEFATTMAATGGGPGHSSEMISINIYKNLYSYYQAGYGQAVALVFVVLLAVGGGLLTRILRGREVDV
ncbi:carbohydrate ABC transporter permease [Cohnella fermenti]|uniref:Sugar ABC transporter permease n=1 Tax=Cohnella fermenti TaxID=2565925 RepID=A0A4V3WE06_9BACL|nr:sugar ABC transporter permease [Cohnella fermenti]THF74315.1 sugar ABC transporter permease [Cohnella fermenti]